MSWSCSAVLDGSLDSIVIVVEPPIVRSIGSVRLVGEYEGIKVIKVGDVDGVDVEMDGDNDGIAV